MARRGLAGAAGLVFPLLCTACGSSSNGAELTVVVAYADGSPAAGVDVTVVPFDVNALVDSLSGAAPTAPPDFTALTDELAAFAASPHVHLGNHTVDHAILTNEDEAGVDEQIRGCQRDLQELDHPLDQRAVARQSPVR